MKVFECVRTLKNWNSSPQQLAMMCKYILDLLTEEVMFKLFWIDACNIQNVVREMSIPVASGRVSGSNWCRLNPPNILRQAFLCGKLGRWFPRDSTLNWKLLSIKIMKQSHAVQKSEFNFESTGYDNCVSQAGFWVTFSVLVALWLRHLTLMTPTFCPVDISLSSNKYSIILTYCFTVTEYKYRVYTKEWYGFKS